MPGYYELILRRVENPPKYQAKGSGTREVIPNAKDNSVVATYFFYNPTDSNIALIKGDIVTTLAANTQAAL